MQTTDFIHLSQLFPSVSWQDLKDFMRKAGEVTFTAAHQQRRNEGVAEFANKESLERALDELDGSEIHGMKIRSGTSLNSLSGVPASIDPIFFFLSRYQLQISDFFNCPSNTYDQVVGTFHGNLGFSVHYGTHLSVYGFSFLFREWPFVHLYSLT